MATILQDKNAPQSGPSPGGTQPVYTAPNQAAAKGSGRFTNIQKYLTANQGGGQQLQQGITQKADQQAEQIRKGVQQSQQQFQQAYNPEQQRIAGAQNFTQQAVQQAGQQQLSPEQIQQFRDIAAQKGSYNQLSGLVGAPTVDPLQQMAQSAGSESGRFKLLKQSFNIPTYNSGQQKLDQLLLGLNNPRALQQNLNQTARTVGSELTAAQKAAADQATTLKSDAQKASEAATTGLSTAQTTLNTDLETRAKTATDQQAKDQQMLMELFGGTVGKGEQGSQDASALLQRLGLKPQDSLFLPSDINPQTFVGPAQKATAGSVASEQEKAKYLALQKLAGEDSPLGLQGNQLDPNGFFNKDVFAQQQNELSGRMNQSPEFKQAQNTFDVWKNNQDSLNAALASGQTEWTPPGGGNPVDLTKPQAVELQKNYIASQFQQAQNALNSQKSQFGATSIQDLINRYGNLPTRNF